MSAYVQPYPGLSLDEPHDEIRLLTLLPGGHDDPIHCSLRNVRRNDIAGADALSYTWGEPPAAYETWINDRPFAVRENLYHALKALRLPDSERLLWIDAVCIDQSNLMERNHQVQQMAQIFGSAKSVIVWLGMETDDIRMAFSFFSEAYLRGASNRKAMAKDNRWTAIIQFCQHPYWKRVWIVQEICLGSNIVVVCGKLRMPWQYITELRKVRKHVWPQYQSQEEREFMRSLPARIDHQKELHSSQSCVLWTLMETFQDSLCQEFHDKVYGFIGLSTDCGAGGLVVDYAKSEADLHRELILLYQKQLGEGSPVKNAPQLLSLSAFIQRLLPTVTITLRPDSTPLVAEPLRILADQLHHTSIASGSEREQPLLSIPATGCYRIVEFPIEFERQIADLSIVGEFLEGHAPYSHIGHWREQFDSRLRDVETFDNASAISHSPMGSSTGIDPIEKFNGEETTTSPTQRDGPKLFRARAGEAPRGDDSHDVFGIAPAGCRHGDTVLTFLGSDITLLFRQVVVGDLRGGPIIHKLGNLSPAQSSFGRLYGQALVLRRDEKSGGGREEHRLRSDKSIESSLPLGADEWTYTVPAWKTRMFIDVPTLRRVTIPKDSKDEAGFARPILDLMPSGEASKSTDMSASAVRGRALDLTEIRKNPDAWLHTLGPPYATIENPASLGYLCCMLQIVFLLKPIRDKILMATNASSSEVSIALHDLFWHLRYRALPASPLRLTKAFGWDNQQINKAQDLFEFHRLFSQRLEELYGEPILYCLRGQMRTTPHDPEYPSAPYTEYFYDFTFNPDHHYLIDCIETDMLADPYRKAKMLFTQLPDVFLMQMKFYKYDFKQDKMITWDDHFEYPPSIDLARVCDDNVKDTEYQLHAVCVLEDVKPVPRYLLYLRPRKENRWILFFKESVTYAKHTEVFEDNFREHGASLSPDAPLRTPYLLMYIKTSRLDVYLG